MDWPYPPSERRQSRLPGGCYHGGVIIDAHTHMFPPEIVERREAYAERDGGFAAGLPALWAAPPPRRARARRASSSGASRQALAASARCVPRSRATTWT